MTTNNLLYAAVQKRRFALLLHADSLDRMAVYR